MHHHFWCVSSVEWLQVREAHRAVCWQWRSRRVGWLQQMRAKTANSQNCPLISHYVFQSRCPYTVTSSEIFWWTIFMAEPGVIGTYDLWTRKGNFLCLESFSAVCLAWGQPLFICIAREGRSFRNISISSIETNHTQTCSQRIWAEALFVTTDLNSQR